MKNIAAATAVLQGESATRPESSSASARLALAAMALLALAAWLLLHPHFDFPFHRIGERIGMVGLLVGFLLVARRLGLADRKSLGYGAPRRVFLREWGLGLVLGVVTMLGIVTIKWCCVVGVAGGAAWMIVVVEKERCGC